MESILIFFLNMTCTAVYSWYAINFTTGNQRSSSESEEERIEMEVEEVEARAMETALVGLHNFNLDTLLDVMETLPELSCQPIYFDIF